MITDRANEAERAEAWTRLMKSTKSNTDDALMDAWRWLTEVIELRERGEVTQEQRIANEAIMLDEDAEMYKGVLSAQEAVMGGRTFTHKRADPDDVCKNCGYEHGEHDEMNRCPNDDGDAYVNRQNRFG